MSVSLLLPLKQQMYFLVTDIDAHYSINKSSKDPHGAIVRDLANKYGLYDEDDRCPSWLCRVVAGRIVDIDNGEHYGGV